MKKFFIVITSILVICIAFIVFLFTPPGNALLKPIVEQKINSNSPIKISFEKFRVGFNNINLKIKFLKNSTADITGAYSLFSQDFNLNYKIHIDNLDNLKNIINYPLRGSVDTKGNVKGNLNNIKIKGFTDFAKSNTNYFVEINNKKISKILAHIKNLDLESLLYIINQPKFLNGILNSDIVINDIYNLNGKVNAKIDGFINNELLRNKYNILLPKTAINLNVNSLMKNKNIDFFADLNSNLLKALIKGKLKNKFLKTKYKIIAYNLSVLTPIINQKIRGKFKTNGVIEGRIDNLILKGKAYLAGGKIDYKTNINKNNFSYNLKNLKVNKLLYMLYQPIYSYGNINSEGNINFKNNLNGKILISIKGKTNNNVLEKEFNWTNAKISYNLNSVININHSIALINTKLFSNVVNAFLPNSKYDVNKNIFTSNYKVVISNLDKFYFVTKKHLRGKITINGKIKKDKNLLVTGNSKTLGGDVNYKLINNDFYLSAKNLFVVKLMDMLMYPQFFDSTANINLKYNILNKKGILNANLINGHFLPNKLSFLINSLAHFDLTKELYKKTTLHCVINNKQIISDLDMKSQLTHISSKKAFVDLEKEYINAKILLEIMKKPIFVKVKGRLISPKIKVDISKFLKTEMKKRIKKEIKKQIEKKLPINLFNMF